MKSIYSFVLCGALCATLSAAGPLNGPNKGRIVNGEDTTINTIPFQVSLEFFGTHTCGGAIVTGDTILTAAHCLDYFSEYHELTTLTVRVGSTFLNREGTVHNLSRVILHEQYDPTTYDYDVAILKLADPLTFGPGVQPVVLARNRQDLRDNEIVQVSGWGRIRTGGPLADVLQKIDMPVLPQEQCREMFKDINEITDRMFCAGFVNGQGDSCNGDSGGPLVNQYNVLYGMVSWGPAQCASQGYAGVYTNVAFFFNWIRSNI